MEALLNQDVFVDFGRDPLMPHPSSPMARLVGSATDELRTAVRTYAPRHPGVYGMIDALGRLVYVGKSKSLRGRLLSYFMPNNEDEKAGRIIQSAVEIVFEKQPSEFAALLRELHLIRTFQPRFNVQGMPNRQKPIFLCLGRAPAETLYISSTPDPKALAWEGPLFGAGRARRAVEVLNRVFQLRDCSNQTKFSFSEQLQLFDLEARPGCLRHEIQTCLGPCVQACSRAAYDRQVQLARDFLRGRSDGILDRIEASMVRAAQRLHFEQAQRIHEDLKVMTWLTRRLEEHAKSRQQLTCLYEVDGSDGRDIWYCIRRGVIEHALPKPNSARTKKSILKEVERWHRLDNALGSKFQRREETLAIVSGWFRKYPGEKGRLIPIESLGQTASKTNPTESPS